MLSAYWGDPPGLRRPARTHGHSRSTSRCSTPGSTTRPTATATSSPGRCTTASGWRRSPWSTLVVAPWPARSRWAAPTSCRKSDYGTIAVDVRTPSSASLEYARSRWRRPPSSRAPCPRPRAPTRSVNATGGRVYVDVGKQERKRSRSLDDRRGRPARASSRSWWAPSTWCSTTSTTACSKPVQIQFYGPDSRGSWRSPTTSWRRCAKIPGAVDVGLSEQEPKDELRIELDRGLANQLGISVDDAAQALRVAFAGVEVGDWVDPIGESRDVAVRLHPDDRVDASNIEHLPIAVAGTNMMVPLEQIATITMDKGPAQHPAPGRQAHGRPCRPTCRAVDAGEVTAEAHEASRTPIDFPHGLRHRAGRRLARPAGSVHRDGHRAPHGHRADVPGAGDAVRLVHRAARR